MPVQTASSIATKQPKIFTSDLGEPSPTASAFPWALALVCPAAVLAESSVGIYH